MKIYNNDDKYNYFNGNNIEEDIKTLKIEDIKNRSNFLNGHNLAKVSKFTKSAKVTMSHLFK